jgi:hypothetical protein
MPLPIPSWGAGLRGWPPSRKASRYSCRSAADDRPDCNWAPTSLATRPRTAPGARSTTIANTSVSTRAGAGVPGPATVAGRPATPSEASQTQSGGSRVLGRSCAGVARVADGLTIVKPATTWHRRSSLPDAPAVHVFPPLMHPVHEEDCGPHEEGIARDPRSRRGHNPDTVGVPEPSLAPPGAL